MTNEIELIRRDCALGRAISSVEIGTRKYVEAYNFSYNPQSRQVYFVVKLQGQDILQDFSDEMTFAYDWIVGGNSGEAG